MAVILALRRRRAISAESPRRIRSRSSIAVTSIHHIADSYVALFSHFIPCGAWEAIYIIEGLLRNASEIQPEKVHADTQGQSSPVFALAHLLGIKLMPRIRNWKDLIFYRPDRGTKYQQIDALFTSHIDWKLIETHWRDLMQVVLSIRAGKISSVTLLRKLGHESRKNRLYQAFRELGRVVGLGGSNPAWLLGDRAQMPRIVPIGYSSAGHDLMFFIPGGAPRE